MTERLITTRQARKEEGGTLILQYFLLTEGTSAGKENFGIKIIEKAAPPRLHPASAGTVSAFRS